MHLMDRQTVGRTEFRQQYRVLHYVQSHGKNEVVDCDSKAVSGVSCTVERIAVSTVV